MNREIEYIPLDLIIIDPAMQARTWTSDFVVEKYTELMSDGIEFDPVRLAWGAFADKYLIIDGNHRVQAARKAGKESIAAYCETLGRRAAQLEALAANARNGKPLDNSDKNKIVMTMLLDDEWSRYSDREIVKHLQCVSQPFVSARRRCLEMIREGMSNNDIYNQRGSYRISIDMIYSIRELTGIKEKKVEIPVPKYPKLGFVQLTDERIGYIFMIKRPFIHVDVSEITYCIRINGSDENVEVTEDKVLGYVKQPVAPVAPSDNGYQHEHNDYGDPIRSALEDDLMKFLADIRRRDVDTLNLLTVIRDTADIYIQRHDNEREVSHVNTID